MSDVVPTDQGAFAPRARRPMVPAAEAQRRLVDAAIALLQTHQVGSVTQRMVSEEAGLHMTTITRNFGSMYGFFGNVSEVLTARVYERMSAVRNLDIFNDSDFLLRTKILAWLIAEGIDPALFQSTAEIRLAGVLLDRFRSEFATADGSPGISQRTAAGWLRIGTFLLEGTILFREVHRVSDEEFLDMALLFNGFIERLPEIERDLGWAED